jgi:hypothetical protein
MTRLVLIFVCATSMQYSAFGQFIEKPVLIVSRLAAVIQLDGTAEDEGWKAVSFASPFYNKWPMDTGFAEAKTEVKMAFDNKFIYILAINHQRHQDVIIQTLKRDQIEPMWNSDAFAVVLDPMNQKTNGLVFGVNAGGAQLEGAINLVGSWSRVNENWDNKWYSVTRVYDDHWITEMAIPFTALRFKQGQKEWGLNFIRSDMKRNVFSTWSRVPLAFNGMDLGNVGTLQWGEPVTPDKSRATLIPYLSGGDFHDFEEEEDSERDANIGLDVKVPLTSSLNLDLTYRPDFSNVDVDKQMTNVTRFSLLFPERRNFFLENADLFTNFGSWQVMPFFSRRIGLHKGDPVPILAGARLSGNLTKGLRVGILDIQTQATEELSANNYLVTSFQQRIFSRSSVKFFGSNRQTTQTIEGDTEHDFNRTFGGEFQYVSTNGRWNAYARAHSSQTPERLNQNDYVSSQVNYQDDKRYAGLLVEKVGENYVNDLGFIPRLYNYDALRDTTVRIGHYTASPWLGFTIYPKKSKHINMIEPNSWSVINYRSNGKFLERNTSLNITLSFKNTQTLYAEAFQTVVNLPFAADILDNDNPIPAEKYSFTQYSVKYTTDSRKALNGGLNVGYGDFYNGTRMEYGATLNFRRQPWGVFGVMYLENKINLKEYGKETFTLIGPRSEISLRNNVWWTTFLQYNTQAENFNLNSRLQWRFKPMSDFFIVYTDNYATTDMKVKNRGLVFKVTYWLNL